jgi:coenzyme F420-0:L-glutamate ligase/coenzyme F420-1:gamma-L-glutamate ligase
MTERAGELRIFGVDGIAEIRSGDDVVGAIVGAIRASANGLEDGDVVVVTHKIVSKAEGRLVALTEIEPSPFAQHLANLGGKDPRQIEVVLRESERVVRMGHGVIISETRHGFVCANAGVDASNVDGREVVCLQPLDPDGSAEAIRSGLREHFGVEVGVIVTDTFGRAWRTGVVNVAIGVAGLAPLDDYRGQVDPNNYELRATVIAVADELAAAAELVMGKLARRPVAIVRGFGASGPPGRAHDLVMDASRDLFR